MSCNSLWFHLQTQFATTSDITLAIGQCTNGCFFQVCLCKKMHYLCDAAWPNQSIRGQEVEFLRMEGRKQLNFPNPSSAELQGFSWKLEVRCDTVSRTLFVPISWAQSCHSVTEVSLEVTNLQTEPNCYLVHLPVKESHCAVVVPQIEYLLPSCSFLGQATLE